MQVLIAYWDSTSLRREGLDHRWAVGDSRFQPVLWHQCLRPCSRNPPKEQTPERPEKGSFVAEQQAAPESTPEPLFNNHSLLTAIADFSSLRLSRRKIRHELRPFSMYSDEQPLT